MCTGMKYSNFVVTFYTIFLTLSAISLIYSSYLYAKHKQNALPEFVTQRVPFRYTLFTVWNFGLQMILLLLAITDEVSKLINLPLIQRPVEKIRYTFFWYLVFPSSLLVVSTFWSIWYIDRELIFPKIVDDFYPSWLNHTLHTLIVIPLIIEVLAQIKHGNVRVSRRRAAIVLLSYCFIYQTLYLLIYFRHGIWLYPIYKTLTWNQRIVFIIFKTLLIFAYQQLGLLFLRKMNFKSNLKTL
ncbi:hypothetical protein ABEB36_006075 [Hypothenemus hampei]|uniref:Androgen-dependent TFPI-regulating protein n=1 Tax=Hypothenemus hampei TaxID=57062 RepID=A0ABD1F0T5_HYPHA